MGLDSEISKQYPETRVATIQDLEAFHQKLYRKDHGSRCPGLSRINFYGDGRPTWAIVLLRRNSHENDSLLIVARLLNNQWNLQLFEKANGATPAVWREGPGTYKDVYGDETKTIHAVRPVIVFCGYESWAIVYAWNGKKVEKVWVSD